MSLSLFAQRWRPRFGEPDRQVIEDAAELIFAGILIILVCNVVVLPRLLRSVKPRLRRYLLGVTAGTLFGTVIGITLHLLAAALPGSGAALADHLRLGAGWGAMLGALSSACGLYARRPKRTDRLDRTLPRRSVEDQSRMGPF